MAAICAPTLSRPLEISTPSDMCGMIQRITLLKMALGVWDGSDSVEYGRCCMRFRARTAFTNQAINLAFCYRLFLSLSFAVNELH
jgi:hypothetical protein